MVSMTGKYLGEKRCALTHGPSNAQIQTDAPKDNHGKGEAFSPTDLMSVSLGSCAMTIMGIYADNHQIDLKNSTFEVVKIMNLNPRRVGEISVKFILPNSLNEKQREALEHCAFSCPVKLSLHENVKVQFTFLYEL